MLVRNVTLTAMVVVFLTGCGNQKPTEQDVEVVVKADLLKGGSSLNRQFTEIKISDLNCAAQDQGWNCAFKVRAKGTEERYNPFKGATDMPPGFVPKPVEYKSIDINKDGSLFAIMGDKGWMFGPRRR